MNVATTLNRIRACHPCLDGWRTLHTSLPHDFPEDRPLPLSAILQSNGIDHAVWALRAVPDLDHMAVLRFLRDCIASACPAETTAGIDALRRALDKHLSSRSRLRYVGLLHDTASEHPDLVATARAHGGRGAASMASALVMAFRFALLSAAAPVPAAIGGPLDGPLDGLASPFSVELACAYCIDAAAARDFSKAAELLASERRKQARIFRRHFCTE